jgi:hypothetical protein
MWQQNDNVRPVTAAAWIEAAGTRRWSTRGKVSNRKIAASTEQDAVAILSGPLARDSSDLGMRVLEQEARHRGEQGDSAAVDDPAKLWQRRKARYFNTQAVARPANGTWGNLGRNVVVGPGINNWDLALSKNFRLWEDGRLQFRTEWFNAFNHSQFTGLSTSFGTGNFGYVTGAASPRMIQFGLRMEF